MQLKAGVAVCLVGAAVLAGCAAGDGGVRYESFMQKCTAAAKTNEERSACAWENAARMAGGGR